MHGRKGRNQDPLQLVTSKADMHGIESCLSTRTTIWNGEEAEMEDARKTEQDGKGPGLRKS